MDEIRIFLLLSKQGHSYFQHFLQYTDCRGYLKRLPQFLKKLFSSSATLVSSIISSFSTNFILLPYFPLLEKRGFTVFQNFRLSEITDEFKLLKTFFFLFYTTYLHNFFASYTFLKTSVKVLL